MNAWQVVGLIACIMALIINIRSYAGVGRPGASTWRLAVIWIVIIIALSLIVSGLGR